MKKLLFGTPGFCRITTWVLLVAGVLGLLGGLVAQPAQAGRVYVDSNGQTVVEVKVHQLPNRADFATNVQAEVEVVQQYVDRFRELFRNRLAEYKRLAATDSYFARFDWDNVRVELVPFSALQVEGVETDLLAIAGGLQPDVLYINFRKSDNYIRSGFLYPLDKPEDGYWSSFDQEQIENRVHPKIMPVIGRIGPTGERHVWAMPYGGALGKVLLYRRDLFDAHGLAYPDKNWTWEDMLEACRVLTNPAKGTLGTALGLGRVASWYWVTFLWSAGGEVMVYDEETDEWQTTFDSREAAKALDFYVTLMTEKWLDENGQVQRGYVDAAAGNNTVMWDRGQVGMITAYIDEKLFATINPEVTGMVPVPLGPPNEEGARTRGGELNARMMGLFAGLAGGGENKVVRDAAWEYMQWITSQEAEKIRTDMMVEGGFGRFVNPRYLEKFGYPEMVRLSPPGWVETFEIAIETGQPEPYGKNSNFAYEIMSQPIERAVQLAMRDALPEDPEERLDVLQQMLRDANERARRQMLGEITPEERTKRDLTAYVVLAGIVVAFGGVFVWIFRVFTPPKEEGVTHQRGAWQFFRYRWAYGLMLPALLTIFTWQYLPLVMGSVLAFQDYKLMGESEWVGVANFGDLLYDAAFWNSIWNAIRYAFLKICLIFLPPIILAILLQEVPQGKIFFRTIFYLPAVITGLVTILLWKQFYTPTAYGTLNSIVMAIPAWVFVFIGLMVMWVCLAFTRQALRHEMRLGAFLFFGSGLLLLSAAMTMAWPILSPDAQEGWGSWTLNVFPRLLGTIPEPIRWLQDPSKAMIATIIPAVWAGMGPGCLIYLAALKGIPDDYYEAADMDGATFIDKILFIVFPMLKPLILINFIGAFIAAWFTGTDNILAMTGGGANTEIVGLFIWYKAFTFLQMGPATAAAWVLGFMLIGFTVWNLRILSKLEFRAGASSEKK